MTSHLSIFPPCRTHCRNHLSSIQSVIRMDILLHLPQHPHLLKGRMTTINHGSLFRSIPQMIQSICITGMNNSKIKTTLVPVNLIGSRKSLFLQTLCDHSTSPSEYTSVWEKTRERKTSIISQTGLILLIFHSEFSDPIILRLWERAILWVHSSLLIENDLRWIVSRLKHLQRRRVNQRRAKGVEYPRDPVSNKRFVQFSSFEYETSHSLSLCSNHRSLISGFVRSIHYIGSHHHLFIIFFSFSSFFVFSDHFCSVQSKHPLRKSSA